MQFFPQTRTLLLRNGIYNGLFVVNNKDNLLIIKEKNIPLPSGIKIALNYSLVMLIMVIEMPNAL